MSSPGTRERIRHDPFAIHASELFSAWFDFFFLPHSKVKIFTVYILPLYLHSNSHQVTSYVLSLAITLLRRGINPPCIFYCL